jgi:hypothetical protein
VVEAYNTEHIVGGPHEVAMAQRDDGAEHEVSMVQLDRGMTLKEALLNSQSKIVEPTSGTGPSLAWDKKLVGALDSACNRTCTGSTWLSNYLQHLKSAPAEIQSLICCEAESETFRFGNGGTQVSSER